jgi:Protein of unknown function (DUF3152)
VRAYLTRGEVSCQNGNRVVLNAKCWLLGADSYGSDLTNYRRCLVNHEFGYALGKHHVVCPGPGKLAPVMMEQTKGSAAAGRTHGRNQPRLTQAHRLSAHLARQAGGCEQPAALIGAST